MNSLSFPDVNLWFALVLGEHVHSAAARRWWRQESGRIAFMRATKVGLLRLLTTAAAMDGKPMTGAAAWGVHDQLQTDERVMFCSDPDAADHYFRSLTNGLAIAPKLWADAWMLAVAAAAGGQVVTFDRALAARGARCLLD